MDLKLGVHTLHVYRLTTVLYHLCAHLSSKKNKEDTKNMKKRKDGRWVKSFTVNNKRVFFYSYADTEAQAEKDIQKQLLNYQNNILIAKHNFKAIGEKMLEERGKILEEATIECYNMAFPKLSRFYDMNIEDIRPSHLSGLLTELCFKGYSKSSVSKVKIVCSLIFDYAVNHDIDIVNFTSSVKIPKIAKQPSKISSVSDSDISVMLKHKECDMWLFAACLLFTGCRSGELNALQKKHIDFDEGLIHIEQAVCYPSNQAQIKPPKTSNSKRAVPIFKTIQQPLFERIQCLNDNDFVFGGKTPMSKTMLNKRWNSFMKECGLKFNMHQLRHSYAFMLYRSGVEAKTAQHLLGHSDIQTTMNIYTDFSKEKGTEAITKAEEFFLKKIIS